jgi:hypothetical protein
VTRVGRPGPAKLLDDRSVECRSLSKICPPTDVVVENDEPRAL